MRGRQNNARVLQLAARKGWPLAHLLIGLLVDVPSKFPGVKRATALNSAMAGHNRTSVASHRTPVAARQPTQGAPWTHCGRARGALSRAGRPRAGAD